MNDDLSKEITEAIKRQLPQHVGAAIQSELEALAVVRATSKAQADKIKTLQETQTHQAAKLLSQEAFVAKEQALAKREAEVLERENKQALRDCEVKMAELRRQDAVALVSLIFKSPVYRERVTGFVPVPTEGMAPNQYGNSGFGGTVQQGAIDKTTERSAD